MLSPMLAIGDVPVLCILQPKLTLVWRVYACFSHNRLWWRQPYPGFSLTVTSSPKNSELVNSPPLSLGTEFARRLPPCRRLPVFPLFWAHSLTQSNVQPPVGGIKNITRQIVRRTDHAYGNIAPLVARAYCEIVLFHHSRESTEAQIFNTAVECMTSGVSQIRMQLLPPHLIFVPTSSPSSFDCKRKDPEIEHMKVDFFLS